MRRLLIVLILSSVSVGVSAPARSDGYERPYAQPYATPVAGKARSILIYGVLRARGGNKENLQYPTFRTKICYFNPSFGLLISKQKYLPY